jgi:hypothetical protein
MSDTKRKTRTITLTDRPPVRIVEEDWPVIAHGRFFSHDARAGMEVQANRTWQCDIRVRRHQDGRAVVYGTYEYSSRWQGERGHVDRAGELLASGDDIVYAIRRVADTLDEITGGEYTAHIAQAERGCVADLPAEEI